MTKKKKKTKQPSGDGDGDGGDITLNILKRDLDKLSVAGLSNDVIGALLRLTKELRRNALKIRTSPRKKEASTTRKPQQPITIKSRTPGLSLTLVVTTSKKQKGTGTI